MAAGAARSAAGVGSGKMAANGSPSSDPASSGVRAERIRRMQNSFVVRTFATLLLLLIMPNFVMAIWYTCSQYGGSYYAFLGDLLASNPLAFTVKIWRSVSIGSPFALSVVGGYCALQLVLMRLVPGQRYQGPTTAKGHVPQYVDNGFRIYVITMATFVALTVYLKSYTPYSPSLVYDRFGDILATMNLFALVFCAVLYVKGIFFPSGPDCGTSGNVVFDYYWGTELYPRILGWDVKSFTNCRVGCTVWALLPCCYALKSYELHGGVVDSMAVYLVIQLAYLTKFFWWEAGYMCTMDIIVDRAGYYICWGCLVYIPGLYTALGYYLVSHPRALGPVLSLAIVALGVSCVLLNYLADRQKLVARRTDGKCTIWGKPAAVVRAKYTTDAGEERSSLLLVSGWWGLARHFHYAPEIGLAFFWTCPAGFDHVLPYSYVIFLVLLLVHRTYRDDVKCSRKYGKYWEEYCRRVPNRILPYLY